MTQLGRYNSCSGGSRKTNVSSTLHPCNLGATLTPPLRKPLCKVMADADCLQIQQVHASAYDQSSSLPLTSGWCGFL
jgi:hypothetical protein